MRVKSVLKNSFYSIASYSIIFIIGLISRKVFLNYFSTEFLGYEGIFNNIFALLSLAEMGITSTITYNLYREVANNNTIEISKLMRIYKLIFMGIGFFSTLIGIILFPFLRFIITDNTVDWSYISYIYCFQLLALIINYFLSYKRILFVVSQMDFVCIRIDVTISVFASIIKIFVIIITQNYLIYLSINILQNFLSNLFVSIKYSKEFKIENKIAISKEDVKKWNIFKDIKNLSIHKVAGLIYGSVDSITISIMLGINAVGLFANYFMIVSQVNMIFSKFTNPLIPSIGNLIHSNDKEMSEHIDLFKSLDLLFFFIGSFIFISLFIIFQTFIEIWLGSKYLLPLSFVFFLSLNSYIVWAQATVGYYRNAFGNYELDRLYMIFSAVTNLVFSIILTYYFGISGIMIGTVIGHLFIWFGRIKVVFGVFLKTSFKEYLLTQLYQIVLVLLELGIVYYFTSFLPISFFGLIMRIILSLLVPNVCNYFIFYKSKRFVLINRYVGISFGILKQMTKKNV